MTYLWSNDYVRIHESNQVMTRSTQIIQLFQVRIQPYLIQSCFTGYIVYWLCDYINPFCAYDWDEKIIIIKHTILTQEPLDQIWACLYLF